VFKENPRFGNERRFIGVMVVDLTKDSQIHVFCKPQGSCVVTLVDQQGLGISDAQVMLLQDGIMIAQNSTNENGVAFLAAPCNRKTPYQLTIIYQGFEVMNESIRLRYNRILVPLKKSVELDQYDWMLTLLDLWGLTPEIDVTPRLTSSAMQTPTMLFPAQNTRNSFQFTDLLPATYHLEIQYKSFAVEKEITIPSDADSLVFPAEFRVSFHVFDSRGTTLEGVGVEMSRGGKIQETTSNGSMAVFSIPPGLYLVKVITQGNVIGQRFLNVVSERSVDLITNQEPVFPLVSLVVSCSIVFVGLALGIKKKEPLYSLLLIMVSVLIIALVFPWWSLQGSSSDIETSSTLYLIPLNLVTTTTTPQIIGGELTFFPEVFATIMMIIPIITVVVSLLAVSVFVLKRINKKGWQMLLLAGALVLLFSSLVLFIGAMSGFAEVGVGSFIGNGPIDISIQGQDVVVPLLCQWGPGVRFWLYVASGFILLSTLILVLYHKKKKQ